VASEKKRRGRSRDRSPRRETEEQSPGAREVYRNIARRSGGAFDDNEVRRALLEEEKLMDEERRTLWLEEELRRTALIEEEERRSRQRNEEQQTRWKKQAEDDEERRRLFWAEMADVRGKMEESIQARMREVMDELTPFVKAAFSKKKSSE
jgi:hypothetical protein